MERTLAGDFHPRLGAVNSYLGVWWHDCHGSRGFWGGGIPAAVDSDRRRTRDPRDSRYNVTFFVRAKASPLSGTDPSFK